MGFLQRVKAAATTAEWWVATLLGGAAAVIAIGFSIGQWSKGFAQASEVETIKVHQAATDAVIPIIREEVHQTRDDVAKVLELERSRAWDERRVIVPDNSTPYVAARRPADMGTGRGR